jgi:hypothetical protein
MEAWTIKKGKNIRTDPGIRRRYDLVAVGSAD